jgi:hypothetical protein
MDDTMATAREKKVSAARARGDESGNDDTVRRAHAPTQLLFTAIGDIKRPFFKKFGHSLASASVRIGSGRFSAKIL